MDLFENLQLIKESNSSIVSEFKEFLNSKNAQYIANEIGETKDGMQMIIYDGDWKHEHLYMKRLLDEFFTNKGIDISIISEEIGESGQDTYSARYDIEFNPEPKEYMADVVTEDIEDSYDNDGIVTELRTNFGSHNELRYEIIQDGTLIFHTTDETLAKEKFKEISKRVPKEYKKIDGKYKRFSDDGELASMWESKSIRYQVTCQLATSNEEVYSEHSNLKDAIKSARIAKQSFMNVKIKDLNDGNSWYNIDDAEADLKDGIVKESNIVSEVTMDEIKKQLEPIDTHPHLKIYYDENPFLNTYKVTIEGTLINGEPICFYDSSFLKTQSDIDFIKEQYAKAVKQIDNMRERGYLGVKDESLIDIEELNNTRNLSNKIKKDIRIATHNFLMSPKCGFPEDEVNEYSRVDVDATDEYIKISVGAELSYDSLFELCQTLDKVISKYDKDAYFEPECPGRIVAYLWTEEQKSIYKEKEKSLRQK